MKELNTSSVDKEFINILTEAKNLKFNEIIIEEDKGIIFNKYENKLISIPYDTKTKIDKNRMTKFFKSLNTNTEIQDRFVETYIYNNEKDNINLFFRVYTFYNRNKITMNIKLLFSEYFDITKYFKNIIDTRYNTPEKIKKLYKDIVDPNLSGIYIISSQTTNIKKNFIYAIIEEINNLKQKNKIIVYERIIEKIINSKNSQIFQMKLKNEKDILLDNRFINPDVVFIENELNEQILLAALSIASEGRKIFITTNYTDFQSLQSYIEKLLEKNNLVFNYFLENFKKFLVLKTHNGKIFMQSIYDVTDIKTS